MNPFSRKTSWIIWIVLVISYLYMAGVVMSGASAKINAVAEDSSCAKPLDLIVTGIDHQQSYRSLECMGLQGRSAYEQIAVWEDSVYPIVYGLLFFFTLLCLLSYYTKMKGMVVACCSLPVLTVVADFLENHFIVRLINEFPTLNTETIGLLSIFNSVKWIMFFLTAALIVLFSITTLLKLLQTARQANK